MSVTSNTPTISVDERKWPYDIIADARQELADLYVVKFPELGLAENKAALDLLVDEKFEQLKWAFWVVRDIEAHLDYLDSCDLRGDLPPMPDLTTVLMEQLAMVAVPRP